MSEWKVLKGEHVCVLWNDKIYHVKEPIVRCKDCKFSELMKVRYSDKKITICNAEWCEGSEGDHPIVDPDGFCAWGLMNERDVQ